MLAFALAAVMLAGVMPVSMMEANATGADPWPPVGTYLYTLRPVPMYMLDASLSSVELPAGVRIRVGAFDLHNRIGIQNGILFRVTGDPGSAGYSGVQYTTYIPGYLRAINLRYAEYLPENFSRVAPGAAAPVSIPAPTPTPTPATTNWWDEPYWWRNTGS